MPTADHINMRANGTIRIVLDGEDYQLRRPKLGEYRRFREWFQRETDDAMAALEDSPVPDVEADPAAAAKASAEQLAALKELLSPKARRERESDIFGWWREVVHVLSDAEHKLPDDDDELPAWILDKDLIRDVLNHWTERPPVPGR